MHKLQKTVLLILKILSKNATLMLIKQTSKTLAHKVQNMKYYINVILIIV